MKTQIIYKIIKNANVMKTQIIYQIKNGLKGHCKVSILFKSIEAKHIINDTPYKIEKIGKRRAASVFSLRVSAGITKFFQTLGLVKPWV